MKYQLLRHPNAIRSKFIKKFVMSYDEFCILYPDTRISKNAYQSLYMWDRLAKGYAETAFEQAL